MTLILGDFLELLPSEENSATISFLFSYELASYHYLNDNFSFGFIVIGMLKNICRSHKANAYSREIEIGNSVEYIANELLENSIKYGSKSSYSISIKIHVFEHDIIIISTNFINKLRENIFQRYIQKVITSDISELYFRQLEENIDNDRKSGLGLLSIINDYKAKVGWKFEPSDCGFGTLSSVMVQLSDS